MIGAHNGPFRKNRGIAQAGLDFDFRANLYQQIDTDGTDMARTSTFTDLVTVSRASKKTNAGGWDFTNGGTVGTLTEVNNNEPALEGTKGILIEESSTNEIRNPRAEGATVGVLGSGGVAPTNWAISSGGGTSQIEIISVADEEIEIRCTGNPSGTAVIYFESTTAIPVTNGDPYTSAVDVSLSAGDFTNVSIVRVGAYWHSAAGAYISQSPGQEIKTGITAARRRFFESATIDNATYERARPSIYYTSTGDVDFTLKIRFPQFEDKEFPTSPILPPVGTPGASTRADDDATLADAAWRNSAQDGETLYVECLKPPLVATTNKSRRCAVAYLKPAAANRGIVVGVDRLDASDEFEFILRADDATVSTKAYSAAGVAVGGVVKMALGWDGSTYSASAIGVTPDHDRAISGNGFDAPDLWIGRGFPTGSFPVDGYLGSWIKDVRYFPEKLTNAQIETLVGN